jgi:predicted secreted protein
MNLQELLNETKRICDAATPGRWMFNSYSALYAVDTPSEEPVASVAILSGDTATKQGYADAAFIAHAREALPRFLSALELAVEQRRRCLTSNDKSLEEAANRSEDAELARGLRGES